MASVRTTIGPMRVLKFPAVSKKKKEERRPSRPVDYCLGKPETSCAPSLPPLSPSALQQRAQSPASSISRHYPHKNTTYLFQIVHSGIFSLSTFFPLSRSTVRPASAPLWSLLCSSPPCETVCVQPQNIHYHTHTDECTQ